MKQTTATVVFIMLAMAGSFESAKAFPSLWSDYYRNALYGRKSAAARMQQDSQQCLTGEAPASIPCQSARLTTGTRNTFVHVCPGDPGDNGEREICYHSKLARCCRSDVERGVLKCVSATKLTVGGQQVTVGIYELGTTPGHCIYFESTSIRSCCLAADQELQCGFSPVTTPPPTPAPCVPKRDIYFVLDATQSIGSSIFCTFGYVMQLIEAAIDPSGGTGGARVSVILFENQFYDTNGQLVRYDASHLLNLDDNCNTAVKTNIPRVVYEYRGVEKKELFHGKDSLSYPQVYAKSTLPYSALTLASSDISKFSETLSRPATVVILTDGKPDQTLTGIINELRSKTAVLIAAGIGSANDINQAKLEDMASSPADAIYEPKLDKVVDFAKRIVERMRDTSALCLYQAKLILDTLEKASMTNLNQYCSVCMFEETPSDICKTMEFPQCGAQNLQMQAFDESNFKSTKLDKNAFSSKELSKLILEEQILAEVEEIMEMGERRKQQQLQEDTIFLTAV